MDFTKETATKKELQVIEDWSDITKCSQIRNTYYFPEETTSLYIKEDVKTLELMFDKYDSDLNKNESIYRGINFEKNNSEKVAYFEAIKEALESSKGTNNTINIDIAPAAFSRARNVAERFGKVRNKNYYTIIYKLNKRSSNEIDIKDGMNDFAHQKEIIIRSQKAIYKVLSISKKNYDTIVAEIIEEES